MEPENISNQSADTNNVKRKIIPKFEKQTSNCRKFSKSKSTLCSVVSDICCMGKSVDILKCDVVIKSVACNKLTHCLFDFDTHELNRPGEVERFNFQMKKICSIYVAIDNSSAAGEQGGQARHQIISPSLIPYTTSEKSDVFNVDETFDDYSLYLPNRQQFITYKVNKPSPQDPNSYRKPHTFPQPSKSQTLSSSLAMRMLFKPHTNTLWVFNKFWCPTDHFLDRSKAKKINQHDQEIIKGTKSHFIPIHVQKQSQYNFENEMEAWEGKNQQKKPKFGQTALQFNKHFRKQDKANTTRPVQNDESSKAAAAAGINESDYNSILANERRQSQERSMLHSGKGMPQMNLCYTNNNSSKLLSGRFKNQKRDRSVPRMRQESARLDRSHPLASSIVSMTNLDDSTNALFAMKENSQSMLESIKQPLGGKVDQIDEIDDYLGDEVDDYQQNGDEMLTPEQLLDQINQDNDVELTSTIWKVLRNQYFAKDNELVDFCVGNKQSKHYIKIGDIIKFGRVNFKVCALRGKGKLQESIQGGYYLLEKKHQKNDQELIDELRRIEVLKTEKTAGNHLGDGLDDDGNQIQSNFINIKENTPALICKNHSRVKNLADTYGKQSNITSINQKQTIMNDNVHLSIDEYNSKNSIKQMGSVQNILATDFASQSSTLMGGAKALSRDIIETQEQYQTNQLLQNAGLKVISSKTGKLRASQNAMISPYTDIRKHQPDANSLPGSSLQQRPQLASSQRMAGDGVYGREIGEGEENTTDNQNLGQIQSQQSLGDNLNINETLMTDGKGSVRLLGSGPNQGLSDRGLSHIGLHNNPFLIKHGQGGQDLRGNAPVTQSAAALDLGKPPIKKSLGKDNRGYGTRFKQNKPMGTQSQMLIQNNYLDKEPTPEEPMVCRICLETEQEAIDAAQDVSDSEKIEDDSSDDQKQNNKKLKNHLICPCKCAGSMGLIHIKCLKSWVNSKRMCYKGDKLYSFFWKSLKCELCNQSFEDKMKFMMFKILKVDLPSHKQYMILESLKSAPAKVIHVFDLSKSDGSQKPKKNKHGLIEYWPHNEFRIGRSVESDMKIADISVSRVHAYIRVEGDQITLEDNGSKFGTMVKILKPEPIIQLDLPKESSLLNKINEWDLRERNQCLLSTGRIMLHIQFGNFQQLSVSQQDIIKNKKKDSKTQDKIGEQRLQHFQDHAYEKWEGTLYSQRLKRVPDDPFSVSSYIPAEFKEYKKDQIIVGYDNLNQEDDSRTVLTAGNENYFLTNDQSQLNNDRILQGDGPVYYRNTHELVDEPPQSHLMSPESSGPDNFTNQARELQHARTQNANDPNLYHNQNPSSLTIEQMNNYNTHQQVSGPANGTAVLQLVQDMSLNSSIDLSRLNQINDNNSSIMQNPNTIDDQQNATNINQTTANELNREQILQMASALNQDSSRENLEFAADGGNDQVANNAQKVPPSPHAPEPLHHHQNSSVQSQQNDDALIKSEMYPKTSQQEQIDFQRASDSGEAQSYVRINQELHVNQGMMNQNMLRNSLQKLDMNRNRRYSKVDEEHQNNMNVLKHQIGRPKRSQDVTTNENKHYSVLAMLDKSQSRLQYRESIESAGDDQYGGIEEEEQEQVIGVGEAGGPAAPEKSNPVVETHQQDDTVSQVQIINSQEHQKMIEKQKNIPKAAVLSQLNQEKEEVIEDMEQE